MAGRKVTSLKHREGPRQWDYRKEYAGARILQDLPATNAMPKHLADPGVVPERRARFRYTYGNCKMETLASNFWVRLHFVATLIWLGVAGYETFGYQGSPEGQIKLIVGALVGAVIIMAVGLGIQWAVNSVARMSR